MKLNQFATNFKTTIEAYLPMIGQADVIPHIKVEDEESEGMISFELGYSGIFVTAGYPILVPSITGERETPGYRVGYWKIHCNYPHAPDDVEDVTYAEHIGIRDTLASVGALFAKQAADNCMPQY